jgi:FAD/FMN-containing dehydrogenase
VDRYSRRRFLGAGGLVAGAASAALAGCAGSATRRPSSSSTSSLRGAPNGSAPSPLDAAAWSRLASALSGRLVLPSSPSYATARLLYDPRFDDSNPAAVALCASAADVQRCVEFARAHGIRPIPRSGGHSYGGYSTGPGLVVDVTLLRTVSVTGAAPGSAHQRAVVGAGTRLIDLYDQLAQAGVLVPGGSCPTVGIAGLALGGGVGVLGRKYGLTCDAIESVEIVTADSRVLTCDPTRHPDLYWACRGGGGGNFGVVTSFTFRADPIPELALFTLDWPWAVAADVLGAWLSWQHGAPDELWSNCQLSAGGSGTLVRTAGMFVGSAASLTSLVGSLVATVGSPPSYRFVGPEQYLHAMLVEAGCESLDVAQCHLRTQNPAGTLDRAGSVASSAYISAPPPPSGIDAFVRSVDDLRHALPGLGGGLVFDAYGGAINAVEPGATAFVHRRAICGIEASVATGSGASAVHDGRAWLAHLATTVAPYVDGSAYQNYIDPTLADWEHAYYGANLGRLVSVKAAYDPDDVFRFAQSIPTHVAGSGAR